MRTCAALAVVFLASAAQAAPPSWQRVQLDVRFRSEGVAIADINKDGKNDIVAGDVWYEAPDWAIHEIRPAGDFPVAAGYSQSFCNWAWDINGDGWKDVIIVGFPGEPFSWYENPQNKPGHWKSHLIWHSICNESPQFKDITGDGRPEVICGSQPEQQLGYLEIPKGDAIYHKWDFIPVGEKGNPFENGTFKYYHGIGATDVNGDNRPDIIIAHGWHEQPAKLGEGLWKWHPQKLAKDDGKPLPGADIYADDLDLDGDKDILMTCAHQYGVWWFENTGSGDPKFHLVDEKLSQTHALWFIDVNGDGQKDLVTGKRYFAHNGADPGAYDPCEMVWYEIKREKGKAPTFTRHVIAEGLDTGIGTQFEMGDINGDGLVDIALSNKKGVNILLQKKAAGAVAAK
jgi:hypothetical protein